MTDDVRSHYERHPYPNFSYLASVRPCDTYALNLESLWARANGCRPPSGQQRILLAGCGSFSPYPTSIANPGAEITALDLSRHNLKRARIHALLHGCRNITYQQGDLLNPSVASGPFAFIDSYGVLHHLPDPRAGLASLEKRLAPGGIIRIMVYSRSARQEAESIRRALRLLKIRDLPTLRKLLKRADKSSRLYQFMTSSPEAGFDAGLADMLLHPRVTTFRIDQLLEMVSRAGLQPLFFAHAGALPDVAEEVARLGQAERDGTLTSNFTVYLGREAIKQYASPADTILMLNPALRDYVGRFRLATVEVLPKLGFPNPLLDHAARKFLRKFVTPRALSELDDSRQREAMRFVRAMFLVELRSKALGHK